MSAWNYEATQQNDREDERAPWMQRGTFGDDVWGFNALDDNDQAGWELPDDEYFDALHAPHNPPNGNHDHAPSLPPQSQSHPPPPAPAPTHQQLPNHLYPLWGTISDDDEPTQLARGPSPTLSDRESVDFVTLEDSTTDEDHEDEDDAADMPPATRSRRTNTSRSSVVDLTSTSSPAESNQARGTKRRRSTDDGGEGPAPKRLTRKQVKDEDIEQLDLTNEETSVDEQLLHQQQKAAIKAQQEEADQGPQKIGQRQCIICMDNYTDATATACGHFFCHECLVQALIAGERASDRGTGSCPVCRKPISRRKKHDIVPIAFMKKSQFAKNQSKRIDA